MIITKVWLNYHRERFRNHEIMIIAHLLFINLLRLTFPNLYHRKTQGVGTILDQITANFLTFHHASLFPRLVIDLFMWLPLNYGTIFLLEIYLPLMLSRRLLKLIYFRRRFPANLLFFILFIWKDLYIGF